MNEDSSRSLVCYSSRFRIFAQQTQTAGMNAHLMRFLLIESSPRSRQWHKDGTGYSPLNLRQANKEFLDIVRYDATTGEAALRCRLKNLRLRVLLTPAVEDFVLSPDQTKMLIYKV